MYMKFRIFALLLCALVLTGCGSTMGQMGSAADSAGRMIQSAGAAVESAAGNQPAAAGSTTNPLTKEQAQTIALAHAGFSADQVTGLRTEYETDDGIPRFEVTFRKDRWEYDYEINAETGAILSYDRDD